MPQIKCLMIQFIQGMIYLHDLDIIHRDIKSCNILVTRQGVVKIADFGLSREKSTNESQLTTNVVTRWYRAPELLLGSKVYDEKIDVWSIGCVFFEMLANGKPLFGGHDENDTIFKIIQRIGVHQDGREFYKKFKHGKIIDKFFE